MNDDYERILMLETQVAQLNGVVEYLLKRVCKDDFQGAKLPLDENPNFIRIERTQGFLYTYNPANSPKCSE